MGLEMGWSLGFAFDIYSAVSESGYVLAWYLAKGCGRGLVGDWFESEVVFGDGVGLWGYECSDGLATGGGFRRIRVHSV